MKFSGNLYNKLLEGIGEGIAAALTRKPSDISGDGMLDIHVPEDSSSFSKHSRLWYQLNAFIATNLPGNDDVIGTLSEDDAAMLCEVFSAYGNDREITELCDRYDIMGLFEPDGRGMERHVAVFPTLSWLKTFSDGNPGKVAVACMTGSGQEIPAEDCRDFSDVRFIRIVTPRTGSDGLVISTDCMSQMSAKRKWVTSLELMPEQQFDQNRYFGDEDYRDSVKDILIRDMDGFGKTVEMGRQTGWTMKGFPAFAYAVSFKGNLGTREFRGYLPSVAELCALCDRNVRPVIGKALSLVTGDGIDAFGKEVVRKKLWVSNGFTDDLVCVYANEWSVCNPCDNLHVLPMFRIG